MARHKAVSSTGTHGVPVHGAVHRDGPSRLLSYAPPWIIWLFALVVALVGHSLWGDNRLYPMSALLATQGGIWVAWRMSKPLHEVLRVLACASVAVFGLFVIVVGVLGMTTVLWSLWGGVGFTVCAYWMIREMLKPASERGAQANGTAARKFLDALNGASVGKTKQIEGEATGDSDKPSPIRVPLTVNRGEQTVDDLKHIPRTVETLAGLRPGAARLVQSATDAGRADLIVNPVDLLEGIVPWRGPSAFGESVTVPIPVGRYASSGEAQIYLGGNEELEIDILMWLVMGMTGAAKSFSIRTLMADLSTRNDVTIWAHDHVKGLQTLKPLIEGGALDWVTMTKADGNAMLSTVKQVIEYRARWMGIRGYDKWTPKCGLNLLVVWIEEASELAQSAILLKLARTARSVGIVLIISLQRASHTTIDTDTRAQLSGNICFGVESETDAKFGLPTHVIDGGASPERWRAERKGYCYIAAPGVPDDKQAEELRWFYAEGKDLIDPCKRGVAVRRPLSEEVDPTTGQIDPVTVKAAGNVYAKRIPPEAYVDSTHPLFAKAIGMDINGPKKIDDEDAVDEIPEPRGSVAAGRVENDDDDFDDDDEELDTTEAERALRAHVDIPPCPAPDMGPATPKQYKNLTTEQCQAYVQEYLKALNSAGKAFVGVPDLLRMTPPIPRKREWIRSELKRLAGLIEGQIPSPQGYRLDRDDDMDAGTYRILEPMPAGEPQGVAT